MPCEQKAHSVRRNKQPSIFGVVKKKCSTLGTFFCVLALTVLAARPRASAQTPLGLNVSLEAGQAQLTVTGAAGTVCQIQWTDNLSATGRWFHLDHHVLGSSPSPFTDPTSASATSRYYRAVWTPNTNLVWIPRGTFTLGSPTNEVDRSSIEGPQAVVTLSRGFWMGKYEVTQGDYLAVVGSNPSYFNGDRSGPPDNDQDYGTDLTRPVELVSWNDATNYCARLTTRERAAGRIPTNSVYRLPTEAEWEYACRAGTTTRFYYGDDPGYTNLAEYAWYLDNSDLQTHPVGQLLPNAWGLYDMAGNVWEWCRDWYAPYTGGSLTDPQGPATGTNRVWRGASWFYIARHCRSARRFLNVPTYTYYGLGFRVALALGQPEAQEVRGGGAVSGEQGTRAGKTVRTPPERDRSPSRRVNSKGQVGKSGRLHADERAADGGPSALREQFPVERRHSAPRGTGLRIPGARGMHIGS